MARWIEAIFRVCVREKSADYCRFRHNLILKYAVVDFDGRHKSAWVDFQVPLVAWAIKWNDDFLVW